MAKVGTIKFHHLTRKYAIIKNLTDIKDVLGSSWNLKVPKYLMFVVDGSKDYKLPPGDSSAFENGLRNTIKNDDVWVISSGEGNVSKYAKAAIRSSRLQSDSSVFIGVTTMDRLEQKGELLTATKPVYYMFDDEITEKRKYLDLESFTHFLLLDISCNHPVFAEEEVRILQTLTTAVSEMDNNQSEINAVLLVPPGNEGNVITMRNAIEAHIPLAILHGKTGVATTLFKSYEEIKRNERTAETRLARVISNSQRHLQYEMVKAIVGKDDLITFQRNLADDEHLVQMAITTALIKVKTDLQGKAQVAFALNRLDIAEKEIMKQSSILTEVDILEFLCAAVKEEKVAFVELCLNLSHDKKINKTDLKHLYVERDNIIYATFFRDKVDEPMAMVERLMKTTIGASYSLADKEIFDCYEGLFLRSVILNKQELALKLWENGDAHSKIEKGLVAYALLLGISKKIRDHYTAGKLKEDADKFNELAIRELHTYYKNGTSDTLLGSLCNGWKSPYEVTTPLHLAALTSNRKFLSSDACQSLLDKTWRGDKKVPERFYKCDDALLEAVQDNNVDYVGLLLKLMPDKCLSNEHLESLYVEEDNIIYDTFFGDKSKGNTRVPMAKIEELMKTRIGVSYSLKGKESFDCYEGLFLRSIILNKQELAIRLWENGGDQLKIEKGLVAYALLHEMSKKIRDRYTVEKLKKDADKFNNLAIGELQTHYKNGTSDNMLANESDGWETSFKVTTPLHLAELTSNKLFLSHDACQSLLDKTWYGDKNVLQDDTEHRISPFITFILHCVSYFLFIFLYSYHLLILLDKTMSYMDAVLAIWVFSYFVEETRQIHLKQYTGPKMKLKAYITDLWNVIDVASIMLYGIGMVVKFLCCLTASRVIFGIDLIVFYFRFLQVLYLHKTMGPKLKIMLEMFWDLLHFLAIMVVFFLAYAVVSHSILFPNSAPNLQLFFDVFKYAYWNIYGELFYDDITMREPQCSNDPSIYNNQTLPRCPTELGKYVGLIMMGVYVLVCNILLLNILIAMFNNSFQRIEDHSHQYSSLQRYLLVMEYKNRLPLPPPLTALGFAACILYEGYTKTRKSNNGNDERDTEQNSANQKLEINADDHELTAASNAAYTYV